MNGMSRDLSPTLTVRKIYSKTFFDGCFIKQTRKAPGMDFHYIPRQSVSEISLALQLENFFLVLMSTLKSLLQFMSIMFCPIPR